MAELQKKHRGFEGFEGATRPAREIGRCQKETFTEHKRAIPMLLFVALRALVKERSRRHYQSVCEFVLELCRKGRIMWPWQRTIETPSHRMCGS